VDDLKLKASPRNTVGKKNRFLRRDGITPTHVFGYGMESLALQCDTAELRRLMARAGRTQIISLKVDNEKNSRNVMVREIQQDMVTLQILHVDFYQVKKGAKIVIDVPIILVGEAPALKTKGRMLAHGVASLNVECLPGSVPPQIEVDLSSLEDIDQAVQVKDIDLGEDVIVHTDAEQMVVKVSHAQMKAQEDESTEAEASAEETPAE
jgi:large subunit ribosomal protein L25